MPDGKFRDNMLTIKLVIIRSLRWLTCYRVLCHKRPSWKAQGITTVRVNTVTNKQTNKPYKQAFVEGKNDICLFVCLFVCSPSQ